MRMGPGREVPRAVCALLQDSEGRFLAVSRRGQPDKLGIPGGKVEDGEDLEQAVVREVLEETGLRIKNLQPVFTAVVRGRTDFLTTTFRADWEGELKPEDGLTVRWVSETELRSGHFGDYNSRLFDSLALSSEHRLRVVK